jgi:hypothetical protein
MGPKNSTEQKELAPDAEPKTTTPSQKMESSTEKENGEYEVMTPEDVESYKEWAKKKIQEWHDNVKPDYILLTETSAVPLGWTLKAAWKEIYPDEETPEFFRSDIGSESDPGGGFGFRDGSLHEDPSQLVSYIEKRKLDKSKNILIFDESSQKPGEKFFHPLKINADENGGEIRVRQVGHSHTLDRNAEHLYKNGFKNVWTDLGSPENYLVGTYIGDYDESPKLKEREEDQSKKRYIKPTRKRKLSEEQIAYSYDNFVGSTEKDPELRKRALAYIHDLKLAGKEAGQELRAELEKSKEAQ